MIDGKIKESNGKLSGYVLRQSDAIQGMRLISSETVDLIVTDPPYSSLEKHRRVGTTTRLKKKWFKVVPNSYFPALLAEMYRVLKPNTHAYIMCDEETRDVLKPMCQEVGFTVQKTLVWNKMRRGMGYNYPASYEFILFLKKGKRKLNTNMTWDVISVPSIRSRSAYPTEKPVELMDVFITESSLPGQVILDPFMGSAPTGLSAVNHGRLFYGIDELPRAFDKAKGRLMGVMNNA